jgi:hypothetical protein
MDDDRSHDEGTACDLPPPSCDAELTRVGRDTPMGALLRRYRYPIGLAADAGDTPRRVRALGEDLILFRDGAGRPGLLTLRPADPARSACAAARRRGAVRRADRPGDAQAGAAGARRIDVGKRCGRHAMSRAAINALIRQHAGAARMWCA